MHWAGWSVVKDPSGYRNTRKVSPLATLTVVLVSGFVKVQPAGVEQVWAGEALTPAPR